MLDIAPFILEERVKHIQENLFNHYRKHNKAFNNNSDSRGRYSYCISVLSGLLSDELTNKRIIEIGPRYYGRFMLDVLLEEGADAVGIDKNAENIKYYYEDYSGPSKGRCIKASLENMSEAIPQESADLVNMMSMHPHPWPEHITQQLSFGSFFQRRKANKYLKEYDNLVAESVDFVLKNKGFLTLWYVPYGDFRLNPEALTKRGFQHNHFDTFFTVPGYLLDVYQKP